MASDEVNWTRETVDCTGCEAQVAPASLLRKLIMNISRTRLRSNRAFP